MKLFSPQTLDLFILIFMSKKFMENQVIIPHKNVKPFFKTFKNL